MSYNKNDKKFCLTVDNIIRLNGDVLVEHYVDRSVWSYYFIRSLDELEDLLNKIGVYDFVTIFKKKQLSCRGILNSKFKEQVLLEYNNKGYEYAIFEYVFILNAWILMGVDQARLN